MRKWTLNNHSSAFNQKSGFLFLSLSLLLLSSSPLRADPTIDRIIPPGAKQGSDVEIELTGKFLESAEELVFEEGLIQVQHIDSVDGSRVKARISIPPDCRLGAHRLRVRTARGLSELRTFRVGATQQVNEIEPNNEPSKAQNIELEQTISGVITGEDVDCFVVHLLASSRIAAVVDGIRLDQEMFDSHLEIIDSRGFVLGANDDNSLLGQDPMLSIVVKEEGDYTIRLRESAYGGNNGCVYLLHVGTFPIPIVAWPPCGMPGEEVKFEWLGDPAGSFQTRVTLPESAGVEGIAEIRPERDGKRSTAPVPVRISSLATVVESEPNDVPDQASHSSIPGAFIGRMDSKNDVDWLRFSASKGTTWRVTAYGRRLGSPIDLVLNAHRDDKKREKITGSDDTDGPDSDMRVLVPDEGSFLVRINDHQRRGGPEFIYRIEAQQVVPHVDLAIPEGRSNTQERLVVTVPQGNRTVAVFNANRTEYSDDVRLEWSDVPHGVLATSLPFVAGSPGGAVLFEASADAPLGTGMARVVVRSAHETNELLGGLRQSTSLVYGNPNQTQYRATISDRLPVAVVSPSPITVHLKAPIIPLVRRGRFDLQVRIERAEGFKGAVKLEFPWKPTGVSALAGVEIPEDISEIGYTINATADAPVRDWQIVVAATPKGAPADKKKGKALQQSDLWVASQPVTLRVAETLIELTLEKSSAEVGQETTILCKVSKPGSFEGNAKCKLMGLPVHVDSQEVALSADVKELIFPVVIGADAAVGKHDNIFCQVLVPLNGEWVIHSMPASQLRIDRPLSGQSQATTSSDDKGSQKLSRREKLRAAQAQSLSKATTKTPEDSTAVPEDDTGGLKNNPNTAPPVSTKDSAK